MGTQKIISGGLETYAIVIALFQIDVRDGKFYFFKNTLLFTDVKRNIAYGILFFT